MTATILLFKVIISSVAVGVLGVITCIGVEVTGKVSDGFFILRLYYSPSCYGVLLKKTISFLLGSIEV